MTDITIRLIIAIVCVIAYFNTDRIANVIIAIIKSMNEVWRFDIIIEYLKEKNKKKKI